MSITAAEAFLGDGAYEMAMRTALLVLGNESLTGAERARAAHIRGVCGYHLGRQFAAVHDLEEARRAAADEAPQMVGSILQDLGRALLRVGDLHAARRALQDALTSAVATSDRAQIVMALAESYRVDGAYEPAIALYTEARGWYMAIGCGDGQAECLLQAAWCYLMKEEYPEARSLLDHLAAIEAVAPAVAVRSAPHLALYYLRTGDMVRSAELVEYGLEQSTTLAGEQYHQVAGELGWISALTALQLHDYDTARRLALSTQQHGLNLAFPDLVNRAHQVRLRADHGLQASVAQAH